MGKYHDLILSATDAEVLANMVGERRRAQALEAAAADALLDLVVEARRVPDGELPADRVALNSKVTYREEPDGMSRSVVLVHPVEADAAAGRISVLSPIGLALLGQSTGALADVEVPGGKRFTVRILDAARKRELRAA